MAQIRMTPDTMRARARQTDQNKQKAEDVMRAMDSLLATLKGEWEGEAVKGYEDRYNKIKPSFKNAKTLLEEIAHNLRATAQIVEETDRNIASQFRR